MKIVRKLQHTIGLLVILALSAMPAFAQTTTMTYAEATTSVQGFIDGVDESMMVIAAIGFAAFVSRRWIVGLLRGVTR
ncbi:MAG: hypothetical protein AAFQ07_20195 [Chloroflexota bacterium]